MSTNNQVKHARASSADSNRENAPPLKLSQVSGSKRIKQRSKFSWTLVNFWLDALMLVNFLALVWVSTVIRFLFPPATNALGWSLWGHSLDGWMATQFALMATLSLGIMIHLMLHWSWVCGVFFGRIRKTKSGKLPDDGIRTIYGVAMMIVILNVLGLLIALATISMQSPI